MDTPVYIGLGSNLGDRKVNLIGAIELISRRIGIILKQSSVYETKAWGITTQPNFLNQVILVSTKLSAQECLNNLAQIEQELGRVRTEKWGPRSIDLDLLYYDQEIIETLNLIVPHPGIADRKFVLIPLAEIAPDFVHPLLLKSNKQLLNECHDQLEVKLAYKLDTST